MQIARAVGAEVVAEGIENRTQVERLKELGAEYGQGYFLGKPQSIAEFADLLKERTSIYQDLTSPVLVPDEPAAHQKRPNTPPGPA